MTRLAMTYELVGGPWCGDLLGLAVDDPNDQGSVPPEIRFVVTGPCNMVLLPSRAGGEGPTEIYERIPWTRDESIFIYRGPYEPR